MNTIRYILLPPYYEMRSRLLQVNDSQPFIAQLYPKFLNWAGKRYSPDKFMRLVRHEVITFYYAMVCIGMPAELAERIPQYLPEFIAALVPDPLQELYVQQVNDEVMRGTQEDERRFLGL